MLFHHLHSYKNYHLPMYFHEYPGFVKEEDLYALAKDILDLASIGLKERGLGEEILLQPLYERVKEHTNPARKLLALRGQGVELEDIILEYATI